jgi:hypothetical protein
MVRIFLHEFSEFAAAHRSGLEYPSDPRDDSADHQLEAFLERLAIDASEPDAGFRGATQRVETEAEVLQSLIGHLRDLLGNAVRRHNRVSWN